MATYHFMEIAGGWGQPIRAAGPESGKTPTNHLVEPQKPEKRGNGPLQNSASAVRGKGDKVIRLVQRKCRNRHEHDQ